MKNAAHRRNGSESRCDAFISISRAETMAFIDQCIATAELWDDLTNQSD